MRDEGFMHGFAAGKYLVGIELLPPSHYLQGRYDDDAWKKAGGGKAIVGKLPGSKSS